MKTRMNRGVVVDEEDREEKREEGDRGGQEDKRRE